MVTVRFAEPLVPKVLSGEKTKTWRLWDDKNLQTGDEVMFVHGEDRKPFARVKLIKVVEKPFGDINEEDCQGHETYSDDRYKVYSEYYNREVAKDTPTKIISFEILEKY